MEPAVASAHDALSFALRGHAGPVVLDMRGVHHPLTSRGGRAFTPYEDVIHLTLSRRALWIGSRRDVAVLPRKAFLRADGPEALAHALLEKLAARPNSRAQLARMAQIEERARACPPSYATWGLTILCVAVYALQLLLGHDVYTVGAMIPALVADGDAWRLVTANLLHANEMLPFHLHILMNLAGLVAFGALCERPLGTARTLAVMGVSGLAAMTASAFSQLPTVGVSGVVFGLVGAVTWLEHFRTDELPAWWRVPRRPLYAMLALSFLLGAVVPFIAGGAHVAGFAGGALTAALLADRPLSPRSAAPVRALAALVVVATVAGVAAAGAELFAPGDFGARHLARIAELPGISPEELNDQAWYVAIDDDSTPEQLAVALSLAERAVAETDRRQATILDTLAELQFLTGAPQAAVATIEEAMALAPKEPYYAEQRRRFLGERSDRPDPRDPYRRAPSPSPARGGELTA
ncbi:MAG TPA: rhomboid family intramembrane serine protease [Myxococcota bacterium]|nr:rhomboid family intramembrane serine protease [Myxococcota bacterium]